MTAKRIRLSLRQGVALFARFLALTAVPNQLAAQPSIEVVEQSLIDRDQRGEESAPYWTINERMQHYGIPGFAMALIDDGEIVYVQGYGVVQLGCSQRVDQDTVFSAGSVSKVVNAALILRLVADGQLDLDEDVNRYLKRWKVPDNAFTAQRKVTLRMILSHTAGFNLHGFPDFLPGEELPTILETLEGLEPAKHDAIRVEAVPGNAMRYSGGGVTVAQLVVEDVTGLPYEEAARRYVFAPLGMNRSSFASPLPVDYGNVAMAHDELGRLVALPRGWQSFPEIAASGLWSSSHDLALFVVALMDSHAGKGNFLRTDLARQMMERADNSWHGLGPRINGMGQKHIFHQGGANDSYRSRIEGHLGTGKGIVLLTNGARGAWLNSEVRKAVEQEFDWSVTIDEDYDFTELTPESSST